MSLTTSNKNCNHWRGMNLVFCIRYFIRNFKYLHCNHACTLSNRNLFCNKLNARLIGKQNSCIATVAVPSATKKSNPIGTKFECKHFSLLH